LASKVLLILSLKATSGLRVELEHPLITKMEASVRKLKVILFRI
jgi:hypothetical protein